ncbi:MAG: enoyl-CoA hydratase-related protein [Chloroflexi bacterium OHK40]
MSADTLLQRELDAGLLLLRLNRPDQRNALNEPLQQELAAALLEAAEDQAVRAVILTGAGEAFCAGGDLGRFEGQRSGALFRLHSQRLTQLIGLIERVEKPVVAAINGLATGAGTQLALACDLRIAADTARLLIREGQIGLIPSHGGTARLVRLVGLARARDILLGGRDLSAEEAHALGLLTAVVSPERLLDEARARLADALKSAPQAYGLAKRLLLLAASADMESALTAESLAQSLLVQSEDHQEGLRARRERRPPRFSGR